MAEKGAHITQTTKAYKNLPSIFDAVATNTLNSYDAIKKFIFVSFYHNGFHLRFL